MINPILERELKTRMRSWKAPIAILVFLVSIGMIAKLGYNATLGNGYTGINPQVMAGYFDTMVIFKLIVVMFVVPILTATSISSEREKQTLDLMLCADVSPWTIIFGKISAALAFVLLLIVLATPFFGIIFILGGVDIFDILKIELYYMFTAFALSTIGIYFSSRFKRNVTAIIMTYVFLAFLYFTPFFIFVASLFQNSFLSGGADSYTTIALLFGANPGFGLLSLLTSGIGDMYAVSVSGSGSILSNVPTWVISCVYFAIISCVMLLLTRKNLKST